MRSHLALVLLLATACPSGSDDLPVKGLWSAQIGSTTVCRVFCDDGLTLQTFGDADACTNWHPDDLRVCFPYEVDGDVVEIDGPPGYKIALSEDGQQLTWSDESGGSTLVYTRIAETHEACSTPCNYAGNENQPLRE